jgi:hypothetical protein
MSWQHALVGTSIEEGEDSSVGIVDACKKIETTRDDEKRERM